MVTTVGTGIQVGQWPSGQCIRLAPSVHTASGSRDRVQESNKVPGVSMQHNFEKGSGKRLLSREPRFRTYALTRQFGRRWARWQYRWAR